ncbi:hypothetical protein, partial [Campylobacter molothri]|uniref:hypothetical protein n=1 Tax=Campylobacter molothri TaxID=1032242 RepID=UPI00301D0586
ELNACEECVKVLDNNEVDLICFNYKRFNDEKEIEEELYYKENQYNIIAFYDFLKSNFPYVQWSIWGKLLKKDKYLSAYNILNLKNDEKINIAEDAFLYMFYLPLCHLIKTLEQCLINYYISRNSLTNGLNPEKLFNIYKEHKILYNKMIQLKKNSKIRNKKYYYLFLISFERAMYNYYFTYLKITKQYFINFKIKKLLLKIKFFILEKIKI